MAVSGFVRDDLAPRRTRARHRDRHDPLVQLNAIGYLIKVIFDQNTLAFAFALFAAMVLFGAFTARQGSRPRRR